MSLKLLALADPKLPWLKPLTEIKGARTTITDDVERARELAPSADVIFNAAFSPELLDAVVPLAAKARWIHNLWAGVEKMLTPAVVASPVPLTNGAGAFARSLGEWTVGAMLYFSYRLRRMIQQQEAQVWKWFYVDELYGKTLGIIGYGGIGRAAAERARAFGVEILALRRRPERFGDDPLINQTFSLPELDDLIAASDFVLVAAPLTAETQGMVGAGQIARMKPAAVLINVGRGAVVDEDALVKALEGDKIRGAALDVFAQEPLPAGHPFYKLSNVLLSPHTADRLTNFVDPAMDCFLENLRRLKADEPLLNVVDKHAGY